MNIKTKLLFIFLFPFSLFANDVLVGKTELGTEFKLSKAEWPIVFRCKHYGGPQSGKFMFSLRKKNTESLALENAWLIFPDHSGYAGELYRNGLDWRFDWTDRKSENRFTISIKRGGEGYYYDWGLAKADGTMTATRTATCE